MFAISKSGVTQQSKIIMNLATMVIVAIHIVNIL